MCAFCSGLSYGGLVSDEGAGRPGDYVLGGTYWRDGGVSSGGVNSTPGLSGGVVTWSVAGAALTNATGTGFFTGQTVDMSSFLPFDYQATLRRAFDTWAANGNIEFIQVADTGGNIGSVTSPTIRIVGGFIDGESGSNTLARAFFPTSSAAGGDIVFDNANTSFFANEQNFFLTALHEIGHALGLDHETANVAIMNPTINRSLSTLLVDDINAIRAAYGTQDFGANIYYMPASQLTLSLIDGAPSLTINGNGSGNTISGSQDGETINGLGGADIIAGQGGNDTILGGDAGDSLFGGTGVDLIVGEAGNDLIYGNEQTDYLDGRQGNDQLFGGDGDDVLFGDGYPSVYGFGSDTLSGEAGNDVIMGESDQRSTSGALDIIYGGNGNDTLFGGGGNDWIFGDAGSDVIDGGEGSDFIVGGTGSDIMVGSGDSTAAGGPAASTGGDLFSYSNISDGGDLIFGFDLNFGTGNDGFDMRSLFSSIGYGGNNPRGDGVLYLFQNGANTDIYIDANGSVGGVQLSHMATVVQMTASNLTNSYFLF